MPVFSLTFLSFPLFEAFAATLDLVGERIEMLLFAILRARQHHDDTRKLLCCRGCAFLITLITAVAVFRCVADACLTLAVGLSLSICGSPF